MLKRMKAIFLASLFCVNLIPSISFAGENVTVSNIEKDVVSLDFTQPQSGFDIKKIEQFVSYDTLEIKNNILSSKSNEETGFNKSMNTFNRSGDEYEPNESSDKAHPINYGGTITANLNTEADQDWYSFDISKYEVENCPRGIYTVILKDVPTGKDYDMYLFQRLDDGSYMYVEIEKRPHSVASYFNISAGSYLLVVFSKDSIPNNFSDEDYTLYVGNAYIHRSTERMETNLKFDFGFNEYPIPFLSKAQYFDLSEDYNIPALSLINAANVTSDGNGAYWIGLTKVLDGYKATPGLDYIPLPKYEIPVKARHVIQSYITRSDGFVWKPRVQIDYIYPLIEDNFRFYF